MFKKLLATAAETAPTRPENPSAFPRTKVLTATNCNGNIPVEFSASGTRGMSLRDYFAGQALVGLIARDGGAPKDQTADTAYAYADALLSKRSENQDAC